jgi:hypothetical protein
MPVDALPKRGPNRTTCSSTSLGSTRRGSPISSTRISDGTESAHGHHYDEQYGQQNQGDDKQNVGV